MVVVERFLEYAILNATPTLCYFNIDVELFYKFVLKNFGIPLGVRDIRYTSIFWTILFTEMKL